MTVKIDILQITVWLFQNKFFIRFNYKKEIDIAVSAIRIDSNLSNVIDSTLPIFTDSYGMIMHNSNSFLNSVLNIFLPFSNGLWTCCLGLFKIF